MSNIVKTCVNHGKLERHQCYKVRDVDFFVCRECAKIGRNKYRAKYRELYKENKGHNSAEALKKKRTSDIIYNLKKRNKLSIEKYSEMVRLQNNLCKICKQPETKIDHRTKILCRLCVDHCHVTGKIRGLLCARCNIALGCFDDSLDVVKSAAQYLESYG